MSENQLTLVDEPTTALAVVDDVFASGGTGFEDTDQDCLAIPYLVVLQKTSPQCDPDDGAYIESARPGMFYNSATGELYSGDEGVLIVPCHMYRRFVEWVPRDAGGGYRGEHLPSDVPAGLERDDSGKFILGNGNYLADTRYHFVQLLTDSGPVPVVLSLTSTQIKKSKNWLTAMRHKKIMNPKTGRLQDVPMFAHVWRLTSVAESNDKGNWKGYNFAYERPLDFKTEGDLYLAGKEFHEMIVSGQAKVDNGDVAESDEFEDSEF